MKQKLLLVFTVVVSVIAILLVADQVLAGTFPPLIFTGQANTAVDSGGALYVFSSTFATTGDAGGRSGMNAICGATDPASHFCTLQEIENAYGTTGVKFDDAFSKAWVDNPLTKSSWGSVYHVCAGWTSDASGYTGDVIFDTGSRFAYSSCQASLPVACCKRFS